MFNRLYGLALVIKALIVLAMPSKPREYALCGSPDTLIVRGRKTYIRDDRTGEVRRTR